jgi:biopolymer transport protein ExbB/TolQ
MLDSVDLALNYLASSSAITLIVLSVLSFYLILITSIYIYRWIVLSNQLRKEENSLNGLIRGDSISSNSILNGCLSKDNISAEVLNACEVSIQKDSTSGLSTLSIVASTSPFIGLFGTVISILESFAQFAKLTKVSFNVVAPVISEALVATAAGIFVAIFAYTFHQILNRKAYELSVIIKAASQIIVSKDKDEFI